MGVLSNNRDGQLAAVSGAVRVSQFSRLFGSGVRGFSHWGGFLLSSVTVDRSLWLRMRFVEGDDNGDGGVFVQASSGATVRHWVFSWERLENSFLVSMLWEDRGDPLVVLDVRNVVVVPL